MSANEPTTTDIQDLIADLDAGILSQKIGRALSDAATGVVNTGKTGKVTITFDMKQIGDSHQIAMSNKLSFTVPTRKGKYQEETTSQTPLHVGRGGKLTIFPEEQGAFQFDKDPVK